MTQISAVASISANTIGFTAKNIRRLVDEKGNEKQFLYRVGGVVEQLITGEGKHGTWYGFKGQFFAATPDKAFESTTIFLPSTLANPIVEQLQQGVTGIEFKGDVFAIETEKNASGYAFLAEPVITATAKEKFTKLQKSVLGEPLPLLAAPDKEEKKKSA